MGLVHLYNMQNLKYYYIWNKLFLIAFRHVYIAYPARRGHWLVRTIQIHTTAMVGVCTSKWYIPVCTNTGTCQILAEFGKTWNGKLEEPCTDMFVPVQECWTCTYDVCTCLYCTYDVCTCTYNVCTCLCT